MLDVKEGTNERNGDGRNACRHSDRRVEKWRTINIAKI